MKWRTPKFGNDRERVRFAWRPVRLNNGWTVWLRRYVEVQLRKVAHDTDGSQFLFWDTVERKEWKP